MVKRSFWIQRVEDAWKRRSVLWVTGVRRIGKTFLCRSLPNVEYFDCELPRVRKMMEDPQGFLMDLKGRRIVLDEIHKLENPSELLKIAADHFPEIKIIATGSSRLEASAKFRDTLTGRKLEIWLTPMMSADLEDFGNTNLRHRLKQGGLPPFFLGGEETGAEFQEWMDSYWAKDIQELFRVERRASFQKFLEMVLVHSGGIFEATAFAAPCHISRPTVMNYLAILEDTRVAHVIRPFSTRRSTEIVAAPKVYAFDTGFVCYFRGWREIRHEDLGPLWELYVLNEIHSRMPPVEIRYWRDKRGHEIDFVLAARGKPPVAIECKWSSNNIEVGNLRAFRSRYPKGENWLVLADVDRTFKKVQKGLEWDCMGLKEMIRRLSQIS